MRVPDRQIGRLRGPALAAALTLLLSVLAVAIPAPAKAAGAAGPPEFAVTFHETGLRAGTPWSVLLPPGQPKMSTTSTVVFEAAPGNYVASVTPLVQYDANQSEITVMVYDGPVDYYISFTKNTTPFPDDGGGTGGSNGSAPSELGPTVWTIVLLAFGGAIVALYYLFGRGPRRSAPSSGSAPPTSTHPARKSRTRKRSGKSASHASRHPRGSKSEDSDARDDDLSGGAD